jgi:ACS family glucarate transporter-like MFS transporter
MNDSKLQDHPTHVRWHIMGLLTFVSLLTYLDRLNLSIAGKYIQDQYSFNTQTMGWILSAFLLGYAIFQIPGGWAVDRFGPRKILTFAISWWSVTTALTAVAPRLPLVGLLGAAWSFAIVRFFIGLGESCVSPNASKVVAAWMGEKRTGIGSSFHVLGNGLGGVVTPVFIAAIMVRWGWQTSFYACSVLGIVTAIIWFIYVRDVPQQHPRVNEEELAFIQPRETPANFALVSPRRRTPWLKMLSRGSVWGLMLGYFCQGYPVHFFHLWFFIYLVRVRGLSVTQGSFWDSAPYVAIALLSPLGGWFSDFAVRHWNKRRGRHSAVWVGMGLSALLLWTGGNVKNTTVSILILATAAGFNMFATPTFWAACVDLTRVHPGSLSGLMNTFGNLGGWLSPIITAYTATKFGWSKAIDLAAIVTLGSGLLFSFVRADLPLEEAIVSDLSHSPAVAHHVVHGAVQGEG